MRGAIKDAWSLGRRPKVCVVGAGFSGLVCAERLGSQGMDVTVLEARDRVGGRVQQLNTLGHWTDMGANWIHGPAKENPIRDLAKKVGAVTLDAESSVLYDEDGKKLSQSRTTRLENSLWRVFGEAFQYCTSHEEISVTESLKDFVTKRVMLLDLSEDEKKVLLQMAEQWGGYTGTPYERQSLKYLFLESGLKEESLFILSTYQKILEVVAKQTRVRAKLLLGTKVTAITSVQDEPHGSMSVSVTSVPSSKVVTQASVSSEQERYDAVVVTVPFGCLQTKQISFSPVLDQKFVHAVESVTYGNLEKVYLKFPRPFWQPEKEERQLFFRMFLHPNYAEENPKHWDLSMMNLDSHPDESNPFNQPTLLFYIYGPCGTHVTNLITGLSPDDPLYLSRLMRFFEPYFSRLPSYDHKDLDCKPIKALATDWQHDAFAGYGSYTNWQIDDNEKYGKPPKMELDKAVETLREGFPERRIWFAGEHTAPFNVLATVTGAYMSGESVAGRIINHFKGT